MEILEIKNSRLVYLFGADRRKGAAYLPSLVDFLNEQFLFLKSPSDVDEILGASKLEFSHGEFEGSAIDSLSIYNDGVVVAAKSSTNYLDKLLEHFIEMIKSEFEFNVYKTKSVDKIYESNLLIRTDVNVLSKFTNFELLSKKINQQIKENSGLELQHELTSISIASEASNNTQLNTLPFSISRMDDAEFSLNHFLCAAPLTTEQHIDALEMVEKM